jgi:hypothetical protein
MTVTVLGHLLQALAHVTKAYYQRIMFEAMFLLAFYAFLRIGKKFHAQKPNVPKLVINDQVL